MTDAAKNLSKQARKLSPAERLELVDDLLASLDEVDPAIDRLWAKEAEERLAAYRRGEIKAVALEEVLANTARSDRPPTRGRMPRVGQAVAYYNGQASGLGDAFLLETIAAIDRIRRFPLAWHALSASTRLRLREKVSQAVFAKYLNTSVSTVQKWEIGEKKPSGPALKLLDLVERKGLKVLA